MLLPCAVTCHGDFLRDEFSSLFLYYFRSLFRWDEFNAIFLRDEFIALFLRDEFMAHLLPSLGVLRQTGAGGDEPTVTKLSCIQLACCPTVEGERWHLAKILQSSTRELALSEIDGYFCNKTIMHLLESSFAIQKHTRSHFFPKEGRLRDD